MANKKRQIQEINAGSMADIAFLLLIFFLVATTMNVDSGITRILPPWNDEKQEQDDVKERNLLVVHVNKFDQIQVQKELIHITQLTEKVKAFVLNYGDDENLPEKEEVEIDLIGTYPVSAGLVSLQSDRGTSYEMYIMVQNELTRAFNEMRNEISEKHFMKKFNELSDQERSAVTKAMPLAISEAEPENIEGVK